MFKNTRPASETISPGGDTSDDDVSLTSTVPGHDSDQEFEVENILAERDHHEDGQTYYLVEWTGFALHDCTWEPESNLGPDLKAIWEEDKAKHSAGELEPFDVEKYNDARRKADVEKAARHRRRNAKRRRLGHPLTAPFSDKSSGSSSDEAVEEPDVEVPWTDLTLTKRQNQRASPQVFSDSNSTPAVAAAAGGSEPRKEHYKQPTAAHPDPQPITSSVTNRRKQTDIPKPTGYQGSARTLSRPSTDALPNLKTKLPSQQPAATSSSVRPNPVARRQLMAKKSTTQPAGNIFTSGKTRTLRGGLKVAISDPAKEAKLFNKHRYRRLAQKASRDREDTAPDVSKMQLFDITKGPVAGRRSSGPVLQSPTQVTAPSEAPMQVESLQPGVSHSVQTPATASSDAARPTKKRKSVRFSETDEGQFGFVEEPEQMDLGDNDTPETSRRLHSPPSRKRPSLDQGRLETPAQVTQNSVKALIFNQSSVQVTFNGLTGGPPNQAMWLADFLGRATLEFQHTCFAKAVAGKHKQLIPRPVLARGTLVGHDNDTTLVQVAEYLTIGLLGLYCDLKKYNIVVYPTKCEEWKSILSGPDAPTPSDALLEYFIFASEEEFRLVLPPLTRLSEAQLSEAQLENERSMPKTPDGVPVSARGLLIQRLFNMEYTRLLPRISVAQPVHSFFLAIPESRRSTAQLLYQWLRACNPNCQIYTSHHAGAWEAFRVRVESMPGAIIIHELLAWSLRRIPRLSHYLIGRNDEYWCLSEPVDGLPLYPSLAIPGQSALPGDMRLTRLFPYRTAILLTPSFLVSEPRRALAFLEWFKKWHGSFHYRLVTAHNFHEYLSELADERYQARQELWKHIGDGQPAIDENIDALSKEECQCRYTAAQMAADLHLVRAVKAGPYAHDEDSSPLRYADSSIDPNDEQSLVNWFGWWATLRADQFRKFHVIGSSQATGMPGSKRSERSIRIPRYSKVTLNNPDAVLEVLQERIDQVEVEGSDPGGGDANLQRPNGESTQSKQAEFIQGLWSFKSDIFQREDSSYFIDYLDEHGRMSGSKFQWVLYKFPVSWLDLQMADHFGDVHSRTWKRIQDWFQFTHPFGEGRRASNHPFDSHQGPRPPYGPAHGYNTYIGFFYTIADEWDSDNLPKRTSPQRHPWIGIYRPVNPHRRPFERCELIIWDPAVRTRYAGKQPPAEKDLIFMQRQMIQYVREHSPEKNKSTFLDQVWLGGWEWPAECNSRYPIDVTLKFLDTLLRDIRAFLPAPEHLMESKGYRRVALGSSSFSSSAPTHYANQLTRSPTADSSLFVDQTEQPDVPMDIDSDTPSAKRPGSSFPKGDAGEEGTEEDEDTRIIFHPPRANPTPSTKQQQQPHTGSTAFRSKCVNRLYEEARLARARAGPGTAPSHMSYRYPPTVEWYSEQRAEGRGFAHVNVDSWEGVFNWLKIGDGGAAGVAGTAGERK